ncbi:DUF4783 domain-containing protein [Parabacteroides sp. Marseille-P3160]|uniref:DUF4783 domain-containing protein n=1 Tax=Parabacteroides sp. Marseille-P3160 TaxID=1917887 RepID=UPI0009B97CD2|nr:DUF4783 domain-containing protein [Parabacteroides sp. Marseille-P3160]
MKKGILLIFALILSALSMQAADITAITNAFKAGNASALAGSMDEKVDIAVPKVTTKGTGAEAVAVLTDFFKANKPTGYTVLHHADKPDTGFFVAKIQTEGGEFRANVTYRVVENKAKIQSIRIE